MSSNSDKYILRMIYNICHFYLKFYSSNLSFAMLMYIILVRSDCK